MLRLGSAIAVVLGACLFLGAGHVWAFPAEGGAPVPLGPAPGQSLEAGMPVTFQIQAPADVFSAWLVVSSSPNVGADGVLATRDLEFTSFAPSGQPGVMTATTRSYSSLADRVGTVFWQAYFIDYRYDPDFAAEGPVQSISLDENRGPVAGVFGQTNAKGFYLNPSPLGIGVSPERFNLLVLRSASRWGLRYLGLAGNRPGVRDGISVVGFSSATPYGVLGVTTSYKKPVWRMRRVCRVKRTRAGGRKRVCRGVPYIARRVFTGESDVELSTSVIWQDGPQLPSVREQDLESTIIHELGHFAGNSGHVSGCVNSPMIDALGGGEYWRDVNKNALYACRR